MSRERLLPAEEERKELQQKINNSFWKHNIAGAVSITSLAASVVFPPAVGGTAVGMIEMVRNYRKTDSMIKKFHQEHPTE